MTSVRKILEARCAADREAWMATPWSLEADGRRWLGACDGRMGLLVEALDGDPDGLRGPPPERADVIRALWLGAGGEPVPVDIGALRSFGVEPQDKECSGCRGGGRHDCPTCDRPMDCRECGGSGLEYPYILPAPLGRVGNELVDRRRVWALLAGLDGTASLDWQPVRDGRQMLRLSGRLPGRAWVAVLMPLVRPEEMANGLGALAVVDFTLAGAAS